MAKKSKKADVFKIPKFLRRKPGDPVSVATAASAAVAAEKVTVFNQDDPLAKLLRSGRYAASALSDPASRAMLEGILAERAAAAAARQDALATARAARKAVWLGYVKVAALAGEYGLRPSAAATALAAAGVLTVRRMVDSGDVPRAREALAGYKPPPARARSPGRPGRVPAARWGPNAVLQVQHGASNPKRPGTGAHARWTKVLASGGLTVAQYQTAGGNPESLANAVKAGLVTVTEGGESEHTGGQDGAKVPRKDGGDVRGEEKKAAAVGPGERDGGQVSRGRRRARRKRA